MPKRIKDMTEWNPKEGSLKHHEVDGEWVYEVMTMEEDAQWWKDLYTYPDRQLYDVCYYQSNPLGLHEEPFEPHVVAKATDQKTVEHPHKCHIGVDICARVLADTEEEAIKTFWKMYDRADKVYLYG